MIDRIPALAGLVFQWVAAPRKDKNAGETGSGRDWLGPGVTLERVVKEAVTIRSPPGKQGEKALGSSMWP